MEVDIGQRGCACMRFLVVGFCGCGWVLGFWNLDLRGVSVIYGCGVNSCGWGLVHVDKIVDWMFVRGGGLFVH